MHTPGYIGGVKSTLAQLSIVVGSLNMTWVEAKTHPNTLRETTTEAVTRTLQSDEVPHTTHPALEYIKESVEDNISIWAQLIGFVAKNKWFFEAHPTIVIINGTLWENGELGTLGMTDTTRVDSRYPLTLDANYEKTLRILSRELTLGAQIHSLLVELDEENRIFSEHGVGLYIVPENPETKTPERIHIYFEPKWVPTQDEKNSGEANQIIESIISSDRSIPDQIRTFYQSIYRHTLTLRKTGVTVNSK
jgi:hypothetical protein